MLPMLTPSRPLFGPPSVSPERRCRSRAGLSLVDFFLASFLRSGVGRRRKTDREAQQQGGDTTDGHRTDQAHESSEKPDDTGWLGSNRCDVIGAK